jgi:peptidyl-prolyl cis-trans isomerase C
MQGQARDQVVIREIFAQEAERRGIAATADFRSQMELARQTLLIRELFEDWRKKNPITDADAKVEYDKFKAQSVGTEYRARHILVEKEEEAKSLLAQLKAGAKFEDLAKANSKDPGSGANGGDLDFAKPESYVPEFGWHIIRLEDTREATFPPFDEVKGQIKQRIEQVRLQGYQEELRAKAKTDYKFAQ